MTRDSKPYITFFVLLVVLVAIVLFINLKLVTVVKTRYHIKTSDPSNELEEKPENQTSRKELMKLAGLNQHVWYLKAKSIDFLCNIPLFPNAPDKKITLKCLNFSSKSENQYVQRVFGFLLPSRSGNYKFGISSLEPSELWLSFDDQVENAKLIADAGEKKKPRKENQNPGPISEEIELRSGKKYFIEVLHIGQRKGSYLSVKLKSPGNEAFLNIEKEVLLPFFQNDFDLKNAFYDIEIPSVASCVNSTKENPFLLEKHTSYSSHEIFAGILPNCDLPNPSESRKLERKTIKLQRHHSIHRKYYTSIFVYPYDMVNRVGSNSDYKTRPLPAWNHDNMLNKTSATNIVELLLNRTRKRLRNDLTLKTIVNVEKSNYFNGSRFLVEIDLSTPSNDIIHVSEHIYHDNHNVCFLAPWKREVIVTFVITAKNQGKWIHVFLDGMVSMIKRTQDQNIRAVIFDYESNDIDLSGAVAWRGLEDKVKIVRKKGRFSKTEAFNLAVQQVKDPHSIVFLMDLHFTIGDGLVNNIRKHTIEGEFIYSPVIIRQWKDTTPHNPRPNKEYGYYDFYGYGLMGIYKSDWDHVGGFSDEAKYGWGGEDYDLMDNVFKQGLDYVRIKCPYLYHFNHDKKGMWAKR